MVDLVFDCERQCSPCTVNAVTAVSYAGLVLEEDDKKLSNFY